MMQHFLFLLFRAFAQSASQVDAGSYAIRCRILRKSMQDHNRNTIESRSNLDWIVFRKASMLDAEAMDFSVQVVGQLLQFFRKLGKFFDICTDLLG